MIKKIKNAPRSAGWAKRVFDFFSRILTRCINKSKKQNSKKIEFQTIFEKVTLEPLKKIWDLYQSIRLEKSVSKMGLMHLICWTNDHFIKKHWNFQEKHDFPGCGFSKFSNISIFRLLTIVSCTVFCQDFHCGNEELIRRSKSWIMTKLHIL